MNDNYRKVTREEQLEYLIEIYTKLIFELNIELEKAKIELENLKGKGRVRK